MIAQTINQFIPRKHPCPVKLSIIYPAYFDQENTDTLHTLLSAYSQLAPEILDHIEFVIIDDCSPIPITLPQLNLNMILLRVGVDKYWNSGGAKNLGAIMASGEKIIITDIDYFFPEHTLRYVLKKRLPGKFIYKFHSQFANGTYLRPHPNTFLLRRGRFLELYGYDEEFSDHYGFEDTMFYRWQRLCGSPILKLSKKYFNVVREVDREKSYHKRERDLIHNEKIALEKQQQWRIYGKMGGHSRKMLRFPFEIVAEHEREVAVPLPTQRYWSKFWHLRWLKNMLLRY